MGIFIITGLCLIITIGMIVYRIFFDKSQGEEKHPQSGAGCMS